MKSARFEQLAGVMMSRVAVPPKKRAPVIDRHTLLVGLDTEYHPITRELLSVQMAIRVGDRLVSHVFEPPGPKIHRGHLLEMLRWFLSVNGVQVEPWRGARRVAFICHAAWAELGGFVEPFYQFRISPMGRGYLATADHHHPVDGLWKIWILDLFSFFSVKLAVIGDAVGLPKIDLDPSNIHNIKRENPELFREYAARDAEIALEAMLQLRAMLVPRWGVDPLYYGTPAAIGGEILKRHYLTSALAPYRQERERIHRKRKDGSWAPAHRTTNLYAGDLAVRDLAIRTLHGGRNEAFTRGLYPNPVVERDVRSMYPHAALCIGLPDEKTRWVPVREPAQMHGMEGFAQVRFTFPADTERPCLPVRLSGDTLLFPLQGESHCTFAEVRLALRLGVQVEIVRAYGFTPGPRERDHELGRYSSALLAEKQKATKGTLNYQFYKDLLNQLLGRLGQKSIDVDVLALEHHAVGQGLAGGAAILSQAPGASIQGVPSVGPLWAPEQLALILGKVRALIGEILVVARAHSVSTDSVIIDAGASIECPALDELRAVGSDMPIEVEGDALFVGRARQYALLKRAPTSKVPKALAQDVRWAVLKVARQGSAESAEQFAQTLLWCLNAGDDVAPMRRIERHVKPEEAARAGREIGEAVVQERLTRFDWDKKRALVDRDCNPFRAWTPTRPYGSRNRREGAERASLVRAGAARRRTRPVTDAKRKMIRQLLSEGRGVRETARQAGVSPSTVASIRDEVIDVLESNGEERT